MHAYRVHHQVERKRLCIVEEEDVREQVCVCACVRVCGRVRVL